MFLRITIRVRPRLHKQAFLDKFSLTSFHCQCKWKNLTNFSLTSALVQKLECQFLNKDTCQGRYLLVQITGQVHLSYFPFTLPRKTCQGKTCQGKLARVYSQQVLLDKRTCQGLTELLLWLACFRENITILQYVEEEIC